jgi:NADH-quinone oxidoreductase subunit M
MHEASSTFSVLSVLIALPAVGAVVIALVSRRRPDVTRGLALLFSIATAAIAVWVLANFETGTPGFQFTESHTWIESLGVGWSVGIDGISLFLVVLTGLLFPIAFLGTEPHHDEKPYYAWLLLLEAGCLGVFLSLDLFQFFVMFEVVLVPMYFLIGGWGYGERVYAANKFFLYTMLGSAFMLVSLLALVFLHQKGVGGPLTFDLQAIADNPGIATETARWLFLGFAVAFSVKVPLFPLHTWLPDAHTQAPTAGSVILAGVMLKLGTYGFLRFGLFLFPTAARYWAPLFLTLGVIGIVYGAVVATMQKDLKRLVAYSSVAHLGFIALGTFAMTNQSLQGAVLQAVNHGISTPALFLLVGMIYERRHTREISALRGLQKSAPILAGVFTLVMLSSIGVPGLNGFVGEFLILIGSFLTARWWTVVATTGVILAALYLLWAYQRVFHGEPDEPNAEVRDLKLTEGLVLAPLLALIVFLGVYPKPLIERIEPSVDALIAHIEDQTGERIQPDVANDGYQVVADEVPEPQPADVEGGG